NYVVGVSPGHMTGCGRGFRVQDAAGSDLIRICGLVCGSPQSLANYPTISTLLDGRRLRPKFLRCPSSIFEEPARLGRPWPQRLTLRHVLGPFARNRSTVVDRTG